MKLFLLILTILITLSFSNESNIKVSELEPNEWTPITWTSSPDSCIKVTYSQFNMTKIIYCKAIFKNNFTYKLLSPNETSIIETTSISWTKIEK